MSEVKQGRATQAAVTALTQYLIESGAENYIEDHYTITLEGSEPTTAVITVQYTDKPSAHELRLQAEQERDTLRTANQRLEGEVARLREALGTAKYRIEQGRVWNGMGWTLTGLHPHGQQQALDAIDAALSTNGDFCDGNCTWLDHHKDCPRSKE